MYASRNAFMIYRAIGHFALLLLLLTLIPSGRGSSTSIAVDPSFKEVIINSVFGIDLNVSDVTDLYLWVVTIEWNPSIIEFQSYTEGPFLKAGGTTAIMDAGFSPGKVNRLVCTVLGPVSGVDGCGSLVTFTFKAMSLGTTPISITFSDLLDSNGEHIAHNTHDGTVLVSPPPTHKLTIHSSPSGVTFTADGTPHTTSWSETYIEGTSVNLVMPETHTVGDAKYYWSQWSDGVTSRSRTVIMDKDVTLTAYFAGPYYELTVTSIPVTGITFTINGLSKTTPYTEWLPQGSYTLEMPETYDGYNWSHWLEDGDTNRIKTIYLHGTTWTGIYVLAAPPPPVGGLWVPINKLGLLAPWITLASLITVAALSIVYAKHRKKQQS
jgi:hypothetical protein